RPALGLVRADREGVDDPHGLLRRTRAQAIIVPDYAVVVLLAVLEADGQGTDLGMPQHRVLREPGDDPRIVGESGVALVDVPVRVVRQEDEALPDRGQDALFKAWDLVGVDEDDLAASYAG